MIEKWIAVYCHGGDWLLWVLCLPRGNGWKIPWDLGNIINHFVKYNFYTIKFSGCDLILLQFTSGWVNCLTLAECVIAWIIIISFHDPAGIVEVSEVRIGIILIKMKWFLTLATNSSNSSVTPKPLCKLATCFPVYPLETVSTFKRNRFQSESKTFALYLSSKTVFRARHSNIFLASRFMSYFLSRTSRTCADGVVFTRKLFHFQNVSYIHKFTEGFSYIHKSESTVLSESLW